jgi:hypothetical protein
MIFTQASGLYPNPQVPPDADLEEVPTRPDQPRSHTLPTSAAHDPLKCVKIPCFGDELVPVILEQKQQLDPLYPHRIVGWHTKRSFLKV